MNRLKIRKTGRFLFAVIFAVVMTALTGFTALAGEKVNIKEGTYYIKAVNGNAKGKVLYWNEKAEDQNICMMFDSIGSKNEEQAVWFIRKNRNFDDYYGIYLYSDYNPKNEYSNRLEIDSLTGRDQPYLLSTKGPHVFCGPYSNQDDAFEFIRESGSNDYTNLSIWSRVDKYRLNRHKVVKPFRADLIYVNANKDNDTNNKLWELVPVNFDRKISQTAPSLSAKQKGKITVNWSKFRNKIKKSEFWSSTKYIEIQCSTKKDFSKNVKTKKIKKGTVNKAKAKSTLSKLKRNKTYYIRARLIDKNGVATNWSKAVKIKTK